MGDKAFENKVNRDIDKAIVIAVTILLLQLLGVVNL